MIKEKRDEEEKEEEYYPRTEEELVDDLCEMYDNGVGEKEITNLMGSLAVKDIDLAKTIYEELGYWINHDEKTRRKL